MYTKITACFKSPKFSIKHNMEQLELQKSWGVGHP